MPWYKITDEYYYNDRITTYEHTVNELTDEEIEDWETGRHDDMYVENDDHTSTTISVVESPPLDWLRQQIGYCEATIRISLGKRNLYATTLNAREIKNKG